MRYTFILLIAIVVAGCSDSLTPAEERVVAAQNWRLEAAQQATTSHFGLPKEVERVMGRDWSRFFQRSLLVQFENFIVFYDFLTDAGIRLDFEGQEIVKVAPFLGDAVREDQFIPYTENARRSGTHWNPSGGASALVLFTLNFDGFENGDFDEGPGMPATPSAKADVMASILLTNFHADLMDYTPDCTSPLYLEHASTVGPELEDLFEFLEWRPEVVNKYPDGERIIYYGYYIGNPAFIVEVASTGRDENCTILASAHRPIVDVDYVFGPQE